MAYEAINDRMNLSEVSNYAYDLSQLFIDYYIDPRLEKVDKCKNKYDNWTSFREALSNIISEKSQMAHEIQIS